MTIVLKQDETNTFKSDARYVKNELKELTQIEGRTYRVLTYVRRLTSCECFMRRLAWALSYITIIPLLFCRTAINRLLNEARTKTETKKVFVPVDYQVEFEKLKEHIKKEIKVLPAFISTLIYQNFSLENYSKLKQWLKARDTLVVWAAIAHKAKLAENDLNILRFPNIEETVEKAEKFGDWCTQNVDKINLLNLEYKRLSNLPKEIGNLSRLTYLYLRGNRFKKLPKEIGNLSRLQALGLSENLLKELPKEIGNLSNLHTLALQNNQLRELPKEIGGPSQLSRLVLCSNQLKRLPKEIGNLSQLTDLNLAFNELQKLPKEIGNLSKLKYLNIICNKLAVLPEEVENLKRLGCVITLDS